MKPIPDEKYAVVLEYLGRTAVAQMVKGGLTEYKNQWELEGREVVLTATKKDGAVLVELECITQSMKREFPL